jgi:hypothetical protein
MDKNIDKDKFNRNWQLYMDNKDPQLDNWLYCKYLHEDIKAIIHNCLYHFDFPDPRLTFKDVEADLLLHLQYKKEVLRKYKGNWYNVLFTLFKRKLYDVLRSYRDENIRLEKLWEYKEYYKDAIEQLEYETSQEQKESGQAKPIALTSNDNELIPDTGIPAQLSQSYMQAVSGHNKPEEPDMNQHQLIYQKAYEAIFKVANKVALTLNLKSESEKETIREEERQDPTYRETDLVIWSYNESQFVPNLEHIEQEAKRKADAKRQVASE